jgi:hypothetical protein
MDKRSNPRNELGWRVPRDGTKSHLIYQFLYDGLSTAQIHALMGGSYSSVGVLIFKIKHPDVRYGHRQKRSVHHSHPANPQQN